MPMTYLTYSPTWSWMTRDVIALCVQYVYVCVYVQIAATLLA
jgi:hypothetical protein